MELKLAKFLDDLKSINSSTLKQKKYVALPQHTHMAESDHADR